MTAPGDVAVAASVPALWDELTRAISAGSRFAGLFATARPEGLLLSAQLAGPGGVQALDAILPAGAARYPALTPRLRAAFWYEREIHDLFGVIPDGHPRLEPLVLPLGPGAARPRPGAPERAAVAEPDPQVLPRHATGPGHVHDPARPGALGCRRVGRIPGGDPRGGHPAPEHAGVLQAPRHREAVRGDDCRGRGAAGRAHRGNGDGRARAGLLPRARAHRRHRGALARRPRPGAARGA